MKAWQVMAMATASGVVVLLLWALVFQGETPPLFEKLPWPAWVAVVIGFGLLSIPAVLVIRHIKKKRHRVIVFRHNFFSRRRGEPPRIWDPDKEDSEVNQHKTDKPNPRGSTVSNVVKTAVVVIFVGVAVFLKVRDIRGILVLVMATLMIGLSLFGQRMKGVEQGKGRRFRLKTPEDFFWLAAAIISIVLIFLV